MFKDTGNTMWVYNDGSDNGIMITGDTLRQMNSAITYDDLLGSAMNWESGGWGSSYIEKNYDDNTVDFAASGDLSDSTKRASFNVQLYHKMVQGTNAYFQMHWHWLQSDTTEFTFACQYRKVKKPANAGLDGVEIGSWTTLSAVTTNTTNNFFTYATGTTIHQVCEWDEIDITDMHVSDILQFRVARTDANSGDMQVLYLDAHYAIDMAGSLYKWVKY